jgi:hypothetical protein
MLRKILKAMRAALRSMARPIDGTWRWVFGSGGDVQVIDDDDGLPAPDAQPEKTVEKSLADHDLRLAQRRDAALIYSYAAKCQLDGVRPEMPPCLSRALRSWLPGLTVYDLKALTDAGVDGIRAHISEGPYIAGVHRVHALPPLILERIPEADFEEEISLRHLPPAPRPASYLRDLLRASRS